MTFFLILFLLTSVAIVVALSYLLGFGLGGSYSASQMYEVRARAAEAQREMHALTRSAFVAMAEEAQRRRSQG